MVYLYRFVVYLNTTNGTAGNRTLSYPPQG